MTAIFPSNPTHNTIFELQKGLFYQYDMFSNSWIKLASNNAIIPLVTSVSDGAMDANDLKKLNRLVLPPPTSTLIGNDCVSPFRSGVINFTSGDSFVGVDGNLKVRNIDSFGDEISAQFPFKIHEHTYGFDFTLDLPEFINELKARGQYNKVGRKGPVGEKGPRGDDGLDNILSGPRGFKGEQGGAPECDLSIDTEIFSSEVRANVRKALVAAEVVVDPDDATKYSIVFDRQNVGVENSNTTALNVIQSQSTWILAVESIVGTPQSVYYVDVEPILDSIKAKYLEEVDRLRSGYKDIVDFWINKMSDLFDEQKDALCCALEYCMSVTKGVQLRQHMEIVAASAASANAQIRINGRNSGEAVEVSSTRSLNTNLNLPNKCNTGSNWTFPQGPSANPGNSQTTSRSMGSELSVISNNINIILDPLVNSNSTSAHSLELPAGKYSVIINKMEAQIDGIHRGNVVIRYLFDKSHRTARFIDKGGFKSVHDAKRAYEGLTVSFQHDGGNVDFWVPSINPKTVSGSIELSVNSVLDIVSPQSSKITEVLISYDKIVEAHNKWMDNRSLGFVYSLSGQDYMILSADNMSFSAFAWPTFDGHTLLDGSGIIKFIFNAELNNQIVEHATKIGYKNITSVVFPTFHN